jgi:hypothetical protein
LLCCALFLCLGSASLAAEKNSLGAGAVWRLPREALMKCLDSNPNASDCLTQVMKRNGASPEALEVNKLLDGDGYLREFNRLGKVSLGVVEFPLRANTNEAAVLLGGKPALVSSELPMDAVAINKDPAYPALKKRFPDLELWPSSAEFKELQNLSDGGQAFVFAYPLLNGCHACEQGGSALISLDFGPDGVYRGPRLLKLAPAR